MFDNAEGWGDNPPFHKPVFVLTHESRETLVKEGHTTFTFVTDGIESALGQARNAAGETPIGPTLEITRVIEFPRVTHIRYRVP